MNKETLSLILSIVMLSIVLFMLIFVMHEDYVSSKKKLTRENMLEEHKKRIKKSKETLNVNNRTVIYQYFTRGGYQTNTCTPESHPHFVEIDKYDVDKKYRRGFKIASIILNTILSIIIVGVIAFGAYSQINKSIYVVNGSTYVTVATNSMSLKNESNTYLDELGLNDQIETHSLIKLDEVNSPSEIKLYGIYAYKDKNNDLIVHRIIDREVRNGVTYYTFRGDANDMSDYYLVKENDILFRYNGSKNVPLGYFISFIGSVIGDVTLIYLIIAFMVLEYYDSKKERIIRKDLELYISELNSYERMKLNY